MAHTIPLAHALDDSHLSPAAPAPVAPAPVDAAALLTVGTARYHHPHYLRVEQNGPDQVRSSSGSSPVGRVSRPRRWRCTAIPRSPPSSAR
jgi:hypothetical protein